MGDALDNLNKIVSGNKSSWKAEALIRKENSDWTERSFKIAVKILREIRAQKTQNGMTQKKLAEEMGVSPQYINKVVKGKENLTLETISKIESVLGISLIEIPMEEFSHVFTVKESHSICFLSKTDSIPISEKVLPYSNNYSKVTGTDG